MWRRKLVTAVALAGFAVAGGARASTETLSLTGQVANSVYGTVTNSGVTFSTWMLPLGGIDAANSLSVSQGDHLDGVVALDQKFTVNIPATSNITEFFIVFGGLFPSSNNTTSGNLKFLTGSFQVNQGGAITTDPNGIALGAGVGSPATITFDSIDFSYDITGLGQSASLMSATLYAYVPNGTFGGGGGGSVPEPATWSLVLIGLGGLGATLRSRRKSAAMPA